MVTVMCKLSIPQHSDRPQCQADKNDKHNELGRGAHNRRRATYARVRPHLNPHGQGFMAAISMNSLGKVRLPAAREIVTFPSSSGWRITSSVERLNSGSSSRNNTP